MISLQRSMHSSQMYTPGPAMSFFTCFWLFPQKEHLSRSPPSPIRAMTADLCPLRRAVRSDTPGCHDGLDPLAWVSHVALDGTRPRWRAGGPACPDRVHPGVFIRLDGRVGRGRDDVTPARRASGRAEPRR